MTSVKNDILVKDIKQDCVADTVKAMPFAVGAMFVRKNLDTNKSNKRVVEAMDKSIREAFKENLKNLNWLDDESRVLLMNKADRMTGLIGKSSFNIYYSMLS